VTGREKICPKCGDSCSPGAKFCGSCGYRFDETGAKEVVRKVRETVRSAESAARTAESAVRTATQVRDLVITPPAEWKVVVGDKLPEALAVKAAGTIQAKATEVVAGKATETIERVVFTTVENPETFPPAPVTPVPGPEGERCASCGASLKPGVKFCGSCGAAVTTPVKAIPISGQCVSCGARLKPGVKFCGSCGAKVPGS
jgi:hypothetical protein